MNTIKLSKEEVFEATEDGTLVQSLPAKYGSLESYVFERGGTNYMITVYQHQSEGWQLETSNTAYKVKPVSKTITEWVKINE